MTYKNVRFKAQTYTDRGPTVKFKNEYNYIKYGRSDIFFNPINWF